MGFGNGVCEVILFHPKHKNKLFCLQWHLGFTLLILTERYPAVVEFSFIFLEASSMSVAKLPLLGESLQFLGEI